MLTVKNLEFPMLKYLNNILSLIFLFLSGCIIENDFFGYRDSIPPIAPKNIYSITGDNWIELNWEHNYENDLDGYRIYRGYSISGYYDFIGFTRNNFFVDYSVKNGKTYYYAISAVDYSGNESELSKEIIYDTPRPEGYNQIIYDFRKFPNYAGYDFSSYMVLPYDDQNTDMFFENYNGEYYMVVWDDTDIQDMGPTNDIYDISVAPLTGWSPTKDVKLRVGNTYVVWTWDNHFAKFRVKAITRERIVFDWAYQLVEGNRELKVVARNNEKRYQIDVNKLEIGLKNRLKNSN